LRAPALFGALALVLVLSCRNAEAPTAWTTAPREAPTVEQDRLFFELLPALVIAIDASIEDSRPDWHKGVEPALTAVDTACRKEAAPACSELHELGDALILTRTFPRLGNLLLAPYRRRLNAALARARAPYYLETAALTVDDRHVVLALSFAIHEVREVLFEDGLSVVALVLARGDSLNWSHDLVGYTDEGDTEVVVLADAIEADLASALGADTVPAWARAAMAELGPDSDVDTFRQRVRARQELWNRLRERARESTLYELGEPGGFSSPIEVVELASRVLDPESLSALRELEEQIHEHPARAALMRHLSTRTAVHEAQHRWDVVNDLGVAIPLRADASPDRAAVNAELSAYLAELAHLPGAARSGLLRLVEQAASAPGTPERTSASLIVPALAGALKLSSDPKAASTWLASEVTSDRIASAARSLWEHWYERPLPGIRLP